MKVTKGKLQVGDVIHFTSGNKYTEKEYDLDAINSNGGISWLLEQPTPVKKVTRKKTKEIQLSGDDVMERGDIVRYATGSELVISGGLAGKRADSVMRGRHKVFRKVTKTKNPWKKTGKILDEMIEAHLMPDIFIGVEGTNIGLYVDGSRKVFYDDNIHLAVIKACQSAKKEGWL